MELQTGTVLYGTKKEGWTAIMEGNTKVVLPPDGGRIRDAAGLRKPGPAEKNPHPVAEDRVDFLALEHDGKSLVAREWAISSRHASV